MNKTIATIISIITIVSACFGVLSFTDSKYVSIDVYAADLDNSYRRDLQQDVNFYQMQKSLLFGQRRLAPKENVIEIDNEIKNINAQLRDTRNSLKEIER